MRNIRFGSILQDEGSELSEDGAHIVNYTGAGITASFGSTNVLTIDVPGTADGVLDLLNLSKSGARQLNLTLGRSEGLAAITDSVQLPIATWAVDNDTLATGTAPPARLGTGTPSSSVFLRGDGAWAAAGGGGTVDGVVSTAHLSTTGARQLDLTLERTNGLSNIQTGINLPIALWAVSDSALATGTAPPDRLGTGTRSGSNFLRADGVWADPPAAWGVGFHGPHRHALDYYGRRLCGGQRGRDRPGVRDVRSRAAAETTVVANPGGSPADALTTITIGSTDYSIEGSGGGGALTLTRDDIANISFTEGDVDIEFTNTNEAIDTGIAVPANTKTILLNWGAASTDATAGLDLPWFALPIEEWERLVGVNAGGTPTQGNTRFTRTWRNTDITTLGGTAARQIWIAKGNNGNIFLFTDNVLYDAHPFRVRFEIHEVLSVVTDVTGGSVSTTFEALTDTPATITASQCVAGNSAGDALEFVACGSGSGDYHRRHDRDHERAVRRRGYRRCRFAGRPKNHTGANLSTPNLGKLPYTDREW